ncbi:MULTISPECIES: hypothetical protein [unclassified Chelatococcus]|uniref:hypothetical protein n=1 Tax=unclassified Chelatococcus TaxID=2638111 RepID=UPI001BCC1CA7|nr:MULTISPECIES: hypothetical protein [unclassified Chelatococcus]MBS7699148.1 hypothetical protein [Chelatococcus sp. YT9]MBX3554929.1 hypothetical protein [Chelatococcus sp.]
MAGLALSTGLGLARRGRRSVPSYDARAKAVFDFWDGVGAAPSAAVKSLLNETIVALLDFGLWSEADLLAFTAATNMIHGVTDLKNPDASKIFSLSNSPTWTDRYGWTGNGTSSYVGTWLFPATNGVRWTVNDAGVWSYTDTDLGASVPDVGAGETYAAFCIPRGSTGSMGGQINRVSGATTLAAVAVSAGLTGISRIDASTERIWRDGVQMAEATVSAVGRPTGQFRICGRSPSIFSTRRVGFLMAGASCVGKEANLNAVVQNYITKIKVVAA